jgi:FtsP/CotA-like multicopper oxidase with cupredoxin domain
MSVPPTCHQDDVLRTLVQPKDPAFEYRVKIPRDHPPGLYWYHPHPHGFSDGQVLGGASGAIVVGGIEQAVPEVAGLPERVLVLRDQPQGQKTEESGERGEDPKDVTINFVPILYYRMVPAVLRVRPAEREFWRVLNASADTYFDLQVLYRRGQYDYVPETLKLVAMDGVPIRPASSSPGFSPLRKSVLIPPGGRGEFIVTTPPAGMPGRFVTRYYDTGPDGLVHPERILANIVSREDSPAAPLLPGVRRRAPVANPPSNIPSPLRQRKLYFSEERDDLKDPKKPARYFLTVEGQTPKLFDMNFKLPDILVTLGAVEDWTVENRAREAHAFHIHQLHFQVLRRDGKAVDEPVWRDTIDLPFWDGKGPYPNVRLRMDFRDPGIAGTFVFHCHLMEHEDGGMMGSIQVQKRFSAR